MNKPDIPPADWQKDYLGRLSKLSKNQLIALALKLKQAQLQVQPDGTGSVNHHASADDSIAIVGIGCRFPGGVIDTASYWDLLRTATSGINEMHNERWDMSAFFDEDPEVGGKIHTSRMGLLDQVDQFDADFFSISPREAESMDPQQRMLLEVAWEAIESSGHSCAELDGQDVGVFIGMMNKDYLHLNTPDIVGLNARHSPYYASGEAFSVAAGRIAYFLGLHGPCLTVDTACSSSLVSLHLACQSLLSGECELALAGGASLILSPEASIVTSNARMLSPTGECWTFDERADGYVRSEGCAVVVLKRLSQAIADGDPILAAIVASSVNHDGRSQGLTAPNSAAQIALMRQALNHAQLDPAQVRFIEAHGTGTPLGDPIEMNAIQAVYGDKRSEAEPLLVGSVKAIIGHAEASAGISGLIKLALSVAKNHIVPQRNFARLNPHIRLREGVQIALREQVWGQPDEIRYGAVNSFGFAGTNAHVIVRSVTQQEVGHKTVPSVWRGTRLLTISALSEVALSELLLRYLSYLSHSKGEAEIDLDALAYTSQVGRNHFKERVALSATNYADLLAALNNLTTARGFSTDFAAGYCCGKARMWPGVAFVFGSDSPSAEDLAKTSSAFDEQFKQAVGRWPSAEWTGEIETERYLTGYAIFKTLLTAGVKPTAVAGTNFVGKLIAASAAGMLSVAQACDCLNRPASERESLIQQWVFSPTQLPLIDVVSGLSCVNTLLNNATRQEWLQQPQPARLLDSVTHKDWLRVEIGVAAPATVAAPGQLRLFANSTPLATWDAALAALYADGFDLDWQALYGDTRPQRLVLPTYAFQRKRYWPRNAKVKQLQDASHGEQNNYQLLWQKVPAIDFAPSVLSPRRFVVLAEAASLPDSSTLPDNVEWLCLPTEWRESTNLVAMFRDWLTTLEVGLRRQPVDLLLWLAVPRWWTHDWIDDAELQNTIASHAAGTARALLHLSQALLEIDQGTDLRLGFITEGVESIDDQTAVNIADGLVNGFVQTLCLEQPQWRPWSIDLDPAYDQSEKVAQIAAALSVPERENHVAFRAGCRYVRRLSEKNKAEIVTAGTANFRGDRAYLISGGLGGIGLEVARWLARRGAGQILLLSRRGMEDSAVAKSMAELLAEGIAATVVQADVADYSKLRAGTEAAGRFPLAGIFHAAGVLDDAPLQNLTEGHFARLMQAKVTGSLNLHRLAQAANVELFVMFSSIANLVGSAGQANYASVNGFAAALGRARHACGLPSTVIHWGPWSQIGMASAQRVQHKIARSGLVLLDPKEAIAAMDGVLVQNKIETQTEAVIVRFDWKRTAAYLAERTHLPLLDNFLPNVSTMAGSDMEGRFADSGLAHELSQLYLKSSSAALKQLTSYVEATVRQVLSIDPADIVDHTRALQELGMDSLLSVELRNRFAAGLKLQLPVSLMFDAPDIAAASQLLMTKLREHSVGSTPASASGSADMLAADQGDDIAIIGLGCRLPGGADGIDAFWEKLIDGVDLVRPFDGSRWDVSRFYESGSTQDGKMYANDGGQINDVHGFDNRFFGISNHEAEYMDPQQRIALEVAWQTIESAAYKPQDLAENAGIFIGPGPSDFADLSQRHAKALIGLMGPGHHISAIPGRIAYLLNWQGPCMAIDTACSSSLVAIHVAAQHLRSGECEVALAGGVNVILSPANNIVLSKAGMLSPAGRCRSFDAGADGYVRSDGCAMVLMKRLADAIKDGDSIWGVIKGSAVNQNGQGQGITAPNSRQQTALIETALARSAIHPSAVRYVEAHGTGTQLGDPIEMTALKQAYGTHHHAGNPLYVGAVKSNIGHTESAAGAAGLIKVLLMMKHRMIPPTLHLKTLNPLLEIDPRVIRIPTLSESLSPADDGELICAVSSFGFSGTNAHVIVAAPDAYTVAAAPRLNQDHGNIFALSARSLPALAELRQRYEDYLLQLTFNEENGNELGDICYSTLVGRCRFEHVVCLYPSDHADLLAQLGALRSRLDDTKITAEVGDRQGAATLTSLINQVQFRFTAGEGLPPTDASQWSGYPRFTEALSEVHTAVRTRVEFAPSHLVDKRELEWFCVLYAGGRCLQYLGIEPDRLLYRGHMWLAAAVLYGEFTLDEAVDKLLHGESVAPKLLGGILLERVAEYGGLLCLNGSDGSVKDHFNLAGGLDQRAWQQALGALWEGGRAVDWQAYFKLGGFKRLPLPTYPFEHRDCSRPQGLASGERSIEQLLADIQI